MAHYDSFIYVLKYIYTGKLILEKEGIDRIFDLIVISKTLELTNFLETMYLLLKEALKKENIGKIKEKAIKYDQIQDRLACDNFINEKTEKLASGSRDNSIKIWNVDSGECIRTLSGHSNIVTSLQLLSNNKLASGSRDNSIKIWNVDSGACIRTLSGHSHFVTSLQLLANNKLASGSRD